MTDDDNRDKPEPVAPAPEAPEANVVVDQGWDAPPAPDLAAYSAPVSMPASAPISMPPPPAMIDEPLVPAVYDQAGFRDALGVTPQAEPEAPKAKAKKPPRRKDDDDDEDDPDRPRNRKTMVVTALSIVVGGGIAALVFLGKANAGKYAIACETDRIAVERGRSFPPWGMTSLSGEEWKPVKIPPEFVCHPQDTEDQEELAKYYAGMVVAQARTLVTDVARVDEAEALLKQAQLLTRMFHSEDDVKGAKASIDHLLGDVAYVRAAARVKAATDSLVEAAKQFDASNALRPEHFTDSNGQATHLRGVIDDLRGAPQAPKPEYLPLDPERRPTAPSGVALPVEPGDGSGSAEPAPAATPDAGVPSGGVLL